MPDFTIECYLENRARWHYNYSVLSITAPGVTFLKDNAAQAQLLARKVNDQLFESSQSFPQALGAFACLPLPDVKAAIEEARYCLDELHFEGVGIYTNYDGRYIGDSFLDLLFEELNGRKATVFVHPVTPIPEPTILDHVSSSVIEYTFDTTRAIASFLFTKWRTRFPDIKVIFSHGGGALPFLASRLALQTTCEFHGGWDYDESLEVLKTFYFDLAVKTSAPQIAALTSLVGTDRLLFASDYPYYPERLFKLHEDGFNS
ncbi:hypothetical protein BKA64DRAFT_482879 [Cadophora sp. MPI-SDFR-AT-0126]|nr:hypothetical protein BKA64DRAFT_482879 [Leotiomycetes sp. MPI-SDFR-AT-0126]